VLPGAWLDDGDDATFVRRIEAWRAGERVRRGNSRRRLSKRKKEKKLHAAQLEEEEDDIDQSDKEIPAEESGDEDKRADREIGDIMFLAANGDEEEEEEEATVTDDEELQEESVEFEGGLVVPAAIWNRLYVYQQVGIKWLWELHCQEVGGILGDEMGLGKVCVPSSSLCNRHVVSHFFIRRRSSLSALSHRLWHLRSLRHRCLLFVQPQ
jgi:hypothetical protein